jgi:hypothetical protein
MMQMQPSLVPNIKGQGLVLAIIVMFVLLCCLKKTLTDVEEELVAVYNLSFYRLIANFA